MANKEKAITFTAVFTKIIIAIAAIALVTCITIVIVKHAGKKAKKDYYECEKYEWLYMSGTNPNTLNRLEDYEYYRLYLNSDDTFTVKFMAKSDEVERSEGGTYVKDGSKYTLTYSKTPSQDLSSTVVYNLEDGKLVREDRAIAPNGTNYTIVQVFTK